MKSALVVVIDMELSIRELMCLILAEAKYQVISLQQPPTTFGINYPNLVILDISPNNNRNKEFYNSMKNDSATASIPIMLTSTTNGLDVVAEHWKADSFISKPFDIDEFIVKIKGLL